MMGSGEPARSCPWHERHWPTVTEFSPRATSPTGDPSGLATQAASNDAAQRSSARGVPTRFMTRRVATDAPERGSFDFAGWKLQFLETPVQKRGVQPTGGEKPPRATDSDR